MFRVCFKLFAYKRFSFTCNTIEDMLCFHILTVLYFEMAALPILFSGSSFGYFSFKKSNTHLPRLPYKMQFINLTIKFLTICINQPTAAKNMSVTTNSLWYDINDKGDFYYVGKI